MQIPVEDFSEPCCDVLISKQGYRLSALDKLCLKELDTARGSRA